MDLIQKCEKAQPLPDGWAHMPSIPVRKGPMETQDTRKADAIREFLDGRLCDSDGKFVGEYSEGSQKWLRLRLEGLQESCC